jgi:A/G-specific adenine glycosylase
VCGEATGTEIRKLDVQLGAAEINKFRKAIYSYYKEHRRELPWRQTQDAYQILVSEIMLQQTQAERVAERYPIFIRQFPTIRVLAEASLLDVLAAWQGLGYNRRAASLKKIGEIISEADGELIADLDFLTSLPGIGYNTACAILVYAFNKPAVFIETNIRTIFLHFFFLGKENVRDSDILPLVERTLDVKDPCKWYSALMDYGTMLKKAHGSLNPKSAHYRKQSPFEGSDRRIRGLLLSALIAHHNVTDTELIEKLQVPSDQARKALHALMKEGFVRETGGRYTIA